MADDDDQKRRLVEETERDKKLREELEEVERSAQVPFQLLQITVYAASTTTTNFVSCIVVSHQAEYRNQVTIKRINTSILGCVEIGPIR